MKDNVSSIIVITDNAGLWSGPRRYALCDVAGIDVPASEELFRQALETNLMGTYLEAKVIVGFGTPEAILVDGEQDTDHEPAIRECIEHTYNMAYWTKRIQSQGEGL